MEAEALVATEIKAEFLRSWARPGSQIARRSASDPFSSDLGCWVLSSVCTSGVTETKHY
jgi:hypothetical protein